ncbi:uncharacterized protein A1O9_13083 [Exophiala aquamarina CBS 119918]|uniref:Uncharacterized protein n=1 Tax=Exophiala aquamarina CBS 119918 TaxID=1182545 RepID=A0A072NTC3_9EURO|nr:uncharacterized protein A1O9_13083 [Exophiala aquamarina CBS 119918]KEF50871.1 hypothetical protein A1O9_13083 [Exophiala aquamarina CBS 119918]
MGSLIDDKIPTQPEPEPIATGWQEQPSLVSLWAKEPYRAPSQVDFKGLSTLVAAEQEATEDHIWALREDAGYFADGKPRLDLSDRANRQIVRRKAIVGVVKQAYGDLLLWLGLRKLLTDLDGVIDPQNLRLLTLLFTLRRFSDLKVNALKVGVPASSPLRSGFARDMRDSTEMLGWKYPKGEPYDHLIFLFQQMWTEDGREKLGLSNLVDELGRMIETDRREKARLSTWALKHVTDLGVLVHTTRVIGRYDEWSYFRSDEDCHGSF